MVAPNRLRTWKRPSRWLPAALLLFILLSAVAYRISSGAGVKRQIAELKKRNLPTSPAELDLWYKRVPASSNAALAFMEARGLFVLAGKTNNPDEMNIDLEVGNPLPDKLAAAVRLHLSRNRETIDQLHAAAKLPETRYPINLTLGPNTLLPQLAELKRMAELLKWEAIDQSIAGNQAEAVRAIHTSFAVARSLELEPVLVSQLVRISLLAINLVAIERVVSEQELSDAELAELQAALDRAEDKTKRGLQIALIGERAIGTSLFDLDFKSFDAMGGGGILTDDTFGFALVPLYELRRHTGASDRDLAFFISALNEYERAAELEFPFALQEVQNIEANLQNELTGKRMRYLVSGMLLPSLSKTMNRGAIIIGQLRCAELGIAALRFQNTHRRAPTEKDLVPDFIKVFPTDPANGEALPMDFSNVGIYVEAPGATELKFKDGAKRKVPVCFKVLPNPATKKAD